ncbi:MAG TPA: hypothetical protein VGN14_05105 [Candidatus Elarobacter sp.]|jgi:hypothetical protein
MDYTNDGEQRNVRDLVADVRKRVERRTFIQDVTEPLTGRIDQRKIAAKFNNLEHAVDDLATAVETIADDVNENEQPKSA